VIITYYGGTCFRLQSGSQSILIDPETKRLKADVTLRTAMSTSTFASEEGADEEFIFPGEYELKGIEIQGIAVDEESDEKRLKTIYVVHWEEVTFAFLGAIAKLPSAVLLEVLSQVEVLFLPAAHGARGLSAEEAVKMVRQIEPALVVPSYEKTPADFLKAMGQKGEPEEKFVFKKKDLVSEKMKVLYLTIN